MFVSLPVIKNRIRSIESTKKVTAAMQMISSAKLSQTEKILSRTAIFYQRLEEMAAHLSTATIDSANGFLSSPASGKLCLCVIASDSGLCGAYNYNILEQAIRFINEQGRDNVLVVVVGKKADSFLRREGVKVEKSFPGLHGRFHVEKCSEIFQLLSSLYLQGRAKAVYLAYTRYGSKVFHKPVITKFLNLEFASGRASRQGEFIFEPSAPRVFTELIPRYLLAKFQMTLLEAFCAEHSARAMAMKSSTDNAKELLEFLILTRNKLRQANITRAIIEIASSVEALGR